MIHLGELLSAHLDGELSLLEAKLVAGHLEVCGACRVEFDDLAAARTAVRMLPALEMPDSVAHLIGGSQSFSRWSGKWMGAVATLVAAVVVSSMVLMDEPDPVPVSASDLGAFYVARVTVERELAPSPRYVDAEIFTGLRGGE